MYLLPSRWKTLFLEIYSHELFEILNNYSLGNETFCGWENRAEFSCAVYTWTKTPSSHSYVTEIGAGAEKKVVGSGGSRTGALLIAKRQKKADAETLVTLLKLQLQEERDLLKEICFEVVLCYQLFKDDLLLRSNYLYRLCLLGQKRGHILNIKIMFQ